MEMKKSTVMSDEEKAKSLLMKNEFTCVLCKGGSVYTSRESGIKPMLDFIAEGTDLNGFSAADKIVGKAAALLFAYAGVKAVYAQVLGDGAADVFEKYKIGYSYTTRTKNIINRTGSGQCPMEAAVSDTEEAEKAYKILKAKVMKGIS